VKYLNLEQKALELLGLDERDDEMVDDEMDDRLERKYTRNYHLFISFLATREFEPSSFEMLLQAFRTLDEFLDLIYVMIYFMIYFLLFL